MSLETDATPKTSIFTDIMKNAKEKKANKADKRKDYYSPKRDAIVYLAKQAAVLGTVIAGTALITLKLSSMKNEKTDEVTTDEAVNTDEI